jgi:NAD(P)H dehydrogenase (quinone)
MPIIGEQRVRLHKNAVDGAVAAGIENIVYTSFVGAGDESNPALVTFDHRATENFIKQSGLKWNFMRDSQYAEAIVQQVLPNAVKTGEWVSNQGAGKIAFISREDCVKTAVALLLGRGEDNTGYDVTGPELISSEEIVQIASDITGKPINFVNISDEKLFEIWDGMGVPRTTENGMKDSPIPWCSEDMVSCGRAIREGLMETISNDVEKLTGEKPKSLRQLIQEAYDRGEL